MAQIENRQRRVWVWVLAALALGIVLYLSLRANRPTVAVRAAAVERGSIVSQVSTNGQIEPMDDFQAHAAAAGEVSKLFVDVGQSVQRGQELVEMDASDARDRLATARATLAGNELGLKNMESGGTQDELLGAQSDLTAAQAQVKAAATALTALQKLQAQGAASANEVTSAQQKLSDAQAKVTSLQARRTKRYSGGDLGAQRALVAQAQAAVAAAQSAYAGVAIRAPFAGTVYEVKHRQYDFVQSGDLLLDLADLTKLRVRAYFDEPEIGKLAAGQPVTIVWPAKPGQTWHGHIEEAPTTITTYGTRNVGESLITVDDAKGDLLPNVNVTVTVITKQSVNVLSLPREALHTEGSRDFVYKIVDGRLVKAPVVVGALNLTQFEVVSGLEVGDDVALASLSSVDLRDGLRVKAQF